MTTGKEEQLRLPCARCNALTIHTRPPKRRKGLDLLLSLITCGLWRLVTMVRPRRKTICTVCGHIYSKRAGRRALKGRGF